MDNSKSPVDKVYSYRTSIRTILADLYTPVSIYLRLRDLYPQSALMESSDYHGHDNSRSFIGIHPIASISVSHGIITAGYPDGTVAETRMAGYATDEDGGSTDRPVKGQGKEMVIAGIGDFIRHFHVTGEGHAYCGLYGYTAFNAVRYFEDIPVRDTKAERNDAPAMKRSSCSTITTT